VMAPLPMVPPEAATLDWLQAAPKNKSKVHMVG